MSRLTGRDNRPVYFLSSGVLVANNYGHIIRDSNMGKSFKNIIEILDGELCIDTYTGKDNQPIYKLKYLVFDILVHHRIRVT